MAKELLTERQRNEIEKYLEDQPNTMPQYIRSLRNLLKKIDYEQMDSDLALMKKLSGLVVPMGRKKNDWQNLQARVLVRQSGGDAKVKIRK
jgi:hypothetical protein